MTDYKNEYQKFADSAVRERLREEGFGRLRLGVFWGLAGPLVMFGSHLAQFTPPRWMAMAVVGTAPLAVLLLVINFIRMPSDAKASSKAILIGLVTLIGAGATIGLANYFQWFK